MKALSLLFLFIGSLMLVTGIASKKEDPRILYRYVPENLYEKQFENQNLRKSMPAMFNPDYSRFFRKL
ncbi:MAG: hypothetical protein CMB80_14645 [Flammeovirgaceae bacterium]|nr:hypothetical protein [Flammeovirgaceae bacterium]|tara:strand:- start:1194 stop:1397 length:204 start_codon:yes stop_codon:yes gene_type:complete